MAITKHLLLAPRLLLLCAFLAGNKVNFMCKSQQKILGSGSSSVRRSFFRAVTLLRKGQNNSLPAHMYVTFRIWTIRSCCLYVFYEYYYHIPSYSLGSIFYQCMYGFISVWWCKLCIFIVMTMYSYCIFMYDYPDWGFSVLFPQL